MAQFQQSYRISRGDFGRESLDVGEFAIFLVVLRRLMVLEIDFRQERKIYEKESV